MGTHAPPIVPISPTQSHGASRKPTVDSCTPSDLEAQTNRPARSWHASRTSNNAHHPHAVARIASQSPDDAAPGGDFSADSDGGASAGSSARADSNASTTLRSNNNKRPRAEDAEENTIPAKRLRRCEDDSRHVRVNQPNSSSSSPSSSASSSSSSNNTCVSSSRLSKWQSPRTSPLGPKSSSYRRCSRVSPHPRRGPSKAYPTTRWECILRNFHLDNMARNPYQQNAQWCQDLFLTGLKDCLQPRYRCLHPYHPDEPGYDEEWPDDSWSDEEWSDGEENDETLTPSDEDPDQVKEEAQAEAGVAQLRISTPNEPSQMVSGPTATFTVVHWNCWEKHLSSKSTTFDSALPWDPPESYSASTNEKGCHGHAFSKPAADVAATI